MSGKSTMLKALTCVVGLAAVVAACAARSEGTSSLDGPPRPRLAAASPEPVEAAAAPVPGPPPPLQVDVAEPVEAAAPPPPPPACPDGMILVDGDWCTDVKETCLEWLEPPEHNELARCKRYGPSECTGVLLKRRFCIDRDEYVPPGESLPRGDVSWTKAGALCEQQGRRLCYESEWELACGGPKMLPYPTGYVRDASLCNFDREPLLDKKGQLIDLREPEDAGDKCVSPYGVRNMSGNVDEWVYRDHTWGVWRSALKGGWWMAARDRCRPATTAHDEYYHELQTGFRCCADPRPAETDAGPGREPALLKPSPESPPDD